MKTAELFCTFTVDRYLFGAPVTRVQEVVRNQAMTPVPLAAPEIRGLLNLRGQIVTAIDLRRRLGLPERQADAAPVHVLLSDGDGAVSLMVDQVEDVQEVSPDILEEPPETVDAAIRALLRGVARRDDRLLLLLDETKAISLS
ncbi:MAG: chemotaxis protein CheW [Verrucomicrobiae bacterium]|nr:chemotaxis protein CheW [Verrucomicrobiae bacterium]